MSEPIRFACAVPVAKWHPLLPAALASLAAQGALLEVALLDASGDERVAEAANASALNFAYHRTGPDVGQAAAIAEGWRETAGEVVFWINADDRLSPDALSRVADAFQQAPAPDVVFGGSEFVDANGRTIGHHDQVRDVSKLLLRSNTISQPSCFVMRAAVNQVGGIDESLHYVMDWDLWIRLYLSGARFQRIDATLSAVYMGEGTKTGLVSARRLGEVFRLVNQNEGPWPALKSTVSLAAATLTRRWSRS